MRSGCLPLIDGVAGIIVSRSVGPSTDARSTTRLWGLRVWVTLMKTKWPRFLALVVMFGAPLFSADAPQKPAPPPAKEKTTIETGYWLTDKSGIRHNSKCRYYKNSQGHLCQRDDGRACKICGG